MEDALEQEMQQVAAVYELITEFLVNYSFQLIGAIIVFIIGYIVARKISQIVLGLCQKKNLDVTLSGFIANVVKILVLTMATIIALGKLGISVTPFVAAIGAVGLGAGLAVQGLLSNYGAGLNIILARPFVVGDTISVQGVTGQVKEVHLAYTVLADEDDVKITIPNRHIVGEILHNSQADSMLELSVGIAYSSDPKQAVQVILNALQSIEGMSEERQPIVGIEAFGDSSINLGIRLWAKTQQRVETLYRANMAIHDALEQASIAIPFPQREVRMLEDK
ncbi:MAG: mechanosensitive ion channel family protein [Pseudohongiellaceae bacterium]|nr:mechanosensitive ion channel family protein [Pseudohongiellaceae bacterium]